MNYTTHPISAWNTKCGYSEHGQRIAAVQLPSGRVYFHDIDRHIDGITDMEITRAYRDVQEFVMHCYLYMHYSGGSYNASPELPDEMVKEMERKVKLAAEGAPSLKVGS